MGAEEAASSFHPLEAMLEVANLRKAVVERVDQGALVSLLVEGEEESYVLMELVA